VVAAVSVPGLQLPVVVVKVNVAVEIAAPVLAIVRLVGVSDVTPVVAEIDTV
jgi:hypothetical protein